MRFSSKQQARHLAAALGLLLSGAAGAQAQHMLAPAHEAAQAYNQAMQAMNAQQWSSAELWLERALMLQPENAEAMVQLAQLLAQRGRTESALAIIQSLLGDVRTPTPQREKLQALVAHTTEAARVASPPPAPARQWAEWTLGRGTNPLVTTQARDITLTLPSGNLTLPLDEIPQPATYASLWVARQMGQGVVLQAQLQHVDLPQASGAVRLAAQGPLPQAWAAQDARAGLWQWQLHTQRLLDGTYRHQAGMVRMQGAYQLHAGVYSEPQAGRHGPYARALRLWAQPQGHLYQAWADLEANTGEGPPGLVRLGGQATFALSRHWQLQAQVQQHYDLEGYSALLANNSRRRILTANAALEYQFTPLAAQGWLVRGYAAQRWSNLPLFAWKDAGAQLVWRAAW